MSGTLGVHPGGWSVGGYAGSAGGGVTPPFRVSDNRSMGGGPPSMPFGSVNFQGLWPGSTPNTPFGTPAMTSGIDSAITYEREGRQRVNFQLTIGIDPEGNKLVELDKGSLLFIRTDEKAGEYQNRLSDVRTLSMMNMHLYTERGRALYGSQTTCEKFLNDWQLFSAQVTDPADWQAEGQMTQNLAMHVSHRIRTPNIWLMCGKKTKVGDRCWLVMRRYKYESPFDSEYADPEERLFGDPAEVEMPLAGDENGQGPRGHAGGNTDYYWQIEPYLSNDSRPPPPGLWSFYGSADDPVPWVGARLYVGYIKGQYGRCDDPDKYLIAAAKGIFPQRYNDDYKKSLRALPELEVYLFNH